MIPNATIVTCIITLFVTLILPVVLMAVYASKNKGRQILSAWLLGAAGFFVTQILIRVPILTFLQSKSWFQAFASGHLFLYAFTLAFTAGLFELAGRFSVAKLMQKNLNYKRSLAAGLGHGSIEAMLLVGMTYINNLIYIFMIRSGAFDTVIAQTATAGVDVTQLYAIQDALISTSPALFLMAGFERILAMTGHVGMSMVVCYGIHTNKPLQASLICLGIHTLLDLTAGINLLAGSVLSQTTAYIIIYAILIDAALLSLRIVHTIRSRWPEKEVSL